jgi:predicted AAA+ superfamily ATPase
MPEAVAIYRDSGDLNRVRRAQENILTAYYGDFSKHIPPNEIARVRLIWDSLPDQLGRENKRFLYSAVKEGSKGRDYEIALQWLTNSGLVHQIKRVSLPNLPLAGYQEHKIFKLYFPDIGLLSALTRLELKSYIDADEKIFSHYKGALTEQFVLQELQAAYPRLPIFYWANDKNTAEVDFVVQYDDRIIPIEVKSGREEPSSLRSSAEGSGGNVRAKRLKLYQDTFNPPVAIRSSLNDYHRGAVLHDIPLYMIGTFASLVAG